MSTGGIHWYPSYRCWHVVLLRLSPQPRSSEGTRLRRLHPPEAVECIRSRLHCRLPKRHEVTPPTTKAGYSSPNIKRKPFSPRGQRPYDPPHGAEARHSAGFSHTFAMPQDPEAVPFRVHLLVERSIVERCDEEEIVVIISTVV
jgi:hypothetical protein